MTQEKDNGGTCRSDFELLRMLTLWTMTTTCRLSRVGIPCLACALGEDNIASTLILKLDPSGLRETTYMPKSTTRTPRTPAPCRSMITPPPCYTWSLDPTTLQSPFNILGDRGGIREAIPAAVDGHTVESPAAGSLQVSTNNLKAANQESNLMGANWQQQFWSEQRD